MGQPAKKVPGKAPVAAKEKQKPIGYVNYTIKNPDGSIAIKSKKGFAIFDNEHTTLEERTLVDLAKANDGVAVVVAELRIIEAKEAPESIDTSKIALVK